jgi:Arc/MetJ family transcription regulator
LRVLSPRRRRSPGVMEVPERASTTTQQVSQSGHVTYSSFERCCLGEPYLPACEPEPADRGTRARNLTPLRYTYHTRQVYDTCMSKVRTNIEIEDDYVQVIMDRYGVRTKTEAVELALRHLAGQPMSREQALSMRGAHAIGEIPADTAPRGAA